MGAWGESVAEKAAGLLARYLQKESQGYRPISVISTRKLRECLLPGDILLVEGDQRLSVAIKYLTQSTWSHAALYVGCSIAGREDEPACLIEADMVTGVSAVPLTKYADFNVRICRAVNLTDAERMKVVDYAVSRLGMQYDIANAIDLVRYLLPQPPVPVRWRRRMLALGSGDPTRAICSTLVAGAFESIGYPILPDLQARDDIHAAGEIRHIRNSRLYTPRDFDISPYFEVIKPSLRDGFNFHRARWVLPEPVPAR